MARADTLESTPASRRASPSVVAPPVTRTEDRAVSSRALEAHAVTSAALHDLLGNAAVTGSDAAGLAEHAVGSAALGMAGFTGVSGPGSAPLSAMRQILRRSQAEAEGLDVRTAAAHIGVRAGQPLPDAIRARLESAFGHDFSHVRIHADGAAAESAEALNALAFTLGRDIYFSRGAFRPQSPDGLELLAHELTHVVQADEGRLPAASGDGLDVSSPSDPHEREAYAMGEAVARDLGGSLGSLADTSSAGSSLDSGGGGGTLRNASPVRSEAPSRGAAAPGSEDLADAHTGPAVTNFGAGGVTDDAPTLAPMERGSAGGSLQGGVTEGAAVASRWGFGGSGRSANATSPTATAGSGTGTSKPGELRLAGHVVKVNAPPSGGGTVETRSMADIAIPGISLKTATVTTGADGTIESGKLHVRLQLGSVFIDSATMSVRKGGVVDDVITGVKVTLPGIGEVPVDVKIGTKNITASAALAPEKVPLGGGILATGGSFRVNIDSAGGVRGNGTVTGTLEGFGNWSLTGQLVSQPAVGVTGTLSVRPDARELSPGLRLEAGGVLTGAWAQTATRLAGKLPFAVEDWLRGSLATDVGLTGTDLRARGRLTQRGERVLGPMTMSSGAFEADVAGGRVALEGGGVVRTERFAGRAQGAYDTTTQVFDGRGTLSLLGPVDLGGRATLREASGTARIERNVPVELVGKIGMELVLGTAPALRAQGERLTWNLTEDLISGGATLTTMRAFTVGVEGGPRVEIAAGASTRGQLLDNRVAAIDGGFPCAVFDSAGKLAEGVADVTWSEGGAAEGAVAFTTSVDYGFPQRDSTLAYLEAGARGRVDVASDTLGVYTVQEARIVVNDPKGGGGRLEGSFQGSIDAAAMKLGGTASTQLVAAWPIPVTWGEVLLTAGAANLTVGEGGVEDAYAQLTTQIVVNGKHPLHIAGEFQGTWNTDQGYLSGGISGVLDEEIRLQAGGDEIVFVEGATVAAPIDKSTIDQLLLDAKAVYLREGAPLLEGQVTQANYRVSAETLSFEGALVLLRDVSRPVAGGKYTATLEKESSPTVTVVDNVLTKIGGQVGVRVDDQEGPLLGGSILDADIDPTTWAASGQAIVATERDLPWPRATEGAIPGAPDWQLTARKGSGLAGNMVEGELAEVQADLTVGLKDPTGDLAEGQITGSANLVDGSNDLQGTVTLAREIPLAATAPTPNTVRPEGWSAALLAGSKVGARVTKEGLQRVSIDASAGFDQAGERVATGNLSGQYKLGDSAEGFTGEARADLAKRLPWHEGTRFSTDVDVGTSVVVEVEKDKLGGGRGTFVLTTTLDGQDTLRSQGDADYAPGEGLNTDPKTTLLRELPMGQGGFKPGDSAWLLPDSQATAHIRSDELVGVDGTLRASLRDASGDYLEAVGAGDWSWEGGEDSVSLDGAVRVVREQELGTMGAWKATLVDKGTSASAHIEDGALTSLQGTVGTRLDRAGAPFAQVAASGGWTPDEGVSGTGAAEMLVEELHITDMGRFGLYMVKGVKAEAEVASNEVKRVGGEVPLELRDGGRKFLRGDLAGDYVLAEEQFTGSGKATVQEDHQLGAVRDLNVFVVKGSSAEVGITQNNVDRIGGDMKVSVRDQSEFLVAGIKDGSWDFKGGTGLTGTGSAEVTRDKELVRTDKYAFALRGGKRGAGAGVVVEQDEIKEVNGNVPFLVSDSAGPLIDGSVSGTWKAATGMLNGNGEVALARDLDFSGGRLRMLKGSGGTAVVVDSALQRFEGQIFASILDAQGLELAKVNANGTFDAVTGEIVHAHGGITVTRVIDVFEGMRVTKIDGQGDIEHNELVKVEGSIDVAFGKDGSNLVGKGTLGGGWRREGERDLFHGEGAVDFDLNKGSKRGITGAGLTGTLGEDSSWVVVGKVSYALNENIGGELELTMDESMDPELIGRLEAKGDLIEGKELFAKKFTLGKISQEFGWGYILGGARLELSLDMLPLTMQGNFEVGPWRPVSAANDVPDFDAGLDLTWGLEFKTAILPYLEIGIGSSMLGAGGGVEGEIAMIADPKLGLHVGLHGQDGDFWGDVGIGVKFAPKMTLSITPYLAAHAGPAEARWDIATYQIAQMELFNFEWQDSLTFGDRDEKGPIAALQDKPSKATKAEKPKADAPDEDRQSSVKVGDKDVSGKDVQGDTGRAGKEDPMAPLMAKLQKVIDVAEALGALATLFDVVKRLVEDLLLGPIGFVKLVWEIFTGKISWSAISDAVKNLVEGIQVIYEVLKDVVPSWWEKIKKFIADGPPNLLNALWGADEEAGKVIRDGESIKFGPPAMLRKLIDTVLDGWVAEGDERNAMLVLETAYERGILGQVVGSGAESMLGSLDGAQDKRARYLFWKAGIPFKGNDRLQEFLSGNQYLGGN